MENLIVDIETNGLLDTVSKVHCIVTKGETITVATTHKEIEEILETLSKSHIIGHNILGFDLEVLKRLYNFEVPLDQVTDTLILSRLIYPDIRQEDSILKRLEPKFWGSHSLRAWGHRL